jgi:hypothetical protein
VIDNKDRDTVDQMVLPKLNRFYLRIFYYWLFDGVLHHAMYSIIKAMASNKAHPWYKYCSTHLGCYNFRMDLANNLISRGISMDWSDVEDDIVKPVRLGNKIMCWHVAVCTVSFAKRDLHMVSATRREVNVGRDLPGQSAPKNEKI